MIVVHLNLIGIFLYIWGNCTSGLVWTCFVRHLEIVNAGSVDGFVMARGAYWTLV